MYYLLCIISGIFNIITRKIYYDCVFKPKSQTSAIWFWVVSILGEFVLFANTVFLSGNFSTSKRIYIILCNFIINLAITYFYTVKHFGYRLLMTILYQAISIISEILVGCLIMFAAPNIDDIQGLAQDACITVISCIVNFIIVLLFRFFWKQIFSFISLKNIILICFTPVSSIIFLILLPYDLFVSNDTNNRFFMIFPFLLIMNLINYILLSNTLNQQQIRLQLENQKRQLHFQSDKYEQLSNVYRDSRRIIHEVKRYNIYIENCIREKQYDKLLDFINECNLDIEKKFVVVNTGNLVIDSMISNYFSMAKERSIDFRYTIRISKEDIPLHDYDLCIILGNLLDNSFQACKNYDGTDSEHPSPFVELKIHKKDHFLVINIENSVYSEMSDKSSAYTLYHGFGLSNVINTVEKYHGLYYQKTEDHIYKTTISIPADHSCGDIL